MYDYDGDDYQETYQDDVYAGSLQEMSDNEAIEDGQADARSDARERYDDPDQDQDTVDDRNAPDYTTEQLVGESDRLYDEVALYNNTYGDNPL